MIRKLFTCTGVIIGLLIFQIAHAALTIEITEGVEGALPIAVVPFDTSKLTSKLATDIAEIVSNDLNRSGVLKALDRKSLPSRPYYGSQVSYPQWRLAAQDYLVVGRIFEKSGGLYNIEFQLLDVLKRKQIYGLILERRKNAI